MLLLHTIKESMPDSRFALQFIHASPIGYCVACCFGDNYCLHASDADAD